MQFVLVVALGYDAAACLEPEDTVAADKSTNRNRLVQRAVQSDETDAAAVGSTVVRFQLADELHGAYLGGTAQGTGREGVDEGLDGVGLFAERSADTADEVDDMAVILHLLIEVHLYIAAVAGEVVAGKVHQHHVFGVLFGVVVQVPGIEGVLLCIAGALRGSGNGVDVGMAAFDTAMGFGRRAENAEAPEVEIEQIGRRVDAAQGTVELEVIACETLLESAGEDYLENVAAQTVGDAAADIRLVLLVRKWGGGGADGAEIVGGVVAVMDGLLHLVQFAGLAGSQHLEEQHLILEVVEDDEVLI